MACLWEAWFEAGDNDIVVLDSIDGEVLRLPKGLPATRKLVEEMLDYPVAYRDRWSVRKRVKNPPTYPANIRTLVDYLKRSREKFELIFKTQNKSWTEGLKK
jgi:hypothetical protein